jgi:hypothetical protein
MTIDKMIGLEIVVIPENRICAPEIRLDAKNDIFYHTNINNVFDIMKL